jgi:UDPglucose 6-dehydrogenase
MGDGGGCHPRDNIAMSWLARKLNLSHDFFSDIMRAREDQTEWLAKLIIGQRERSNLPVVVLGRAFKPDTNLIVGSPAVLLRNMLDEHGVESRQYDPFTDTGFDEKQVLSNPAIFFLGTKHEVFKDYLFPRGSIVLDPWGYIPDCEGVAVVRIGRTRNRT